MTGPGGAEGTIPDTGAAEFPPLPVLSEPFEPSPACDEPESKGALETLRELGQIHTALLSLTADWRLAVECVLRAALHLGGASRGVLFLLEEGELEVAHAIGFPEGVELPGPVRGFVAQATSARGALWRDAASEGRRCDICVPLAYPARPVAPFIPERRRVSIARVPFGEPMGLLYVEGAEAPLEGVDALVSRLTLFAGQAATVVVNARWLQLATTDPLTGLLTRDRFSLALENLFAQAVVDRSPVTVLLADITGLREINAAYGRACGDQLIRQVARVLRKLSRRSDFLARWSGDEFAIALPNTDTAEALQVADRIRRTAPSIPTPGAGEPRDPALKERCVLTRLAIGIATWPSHGRSAWEVLLHADQALHSAGCEGGGRVEIWTPDESGAAPRADRLAGVMTGIFAEDATNVRHLLELMHVLLTEAKPEDVWRRLVDGLTEAADAHLGVLFRAEPSGRIVEEAWCAPSGGGSGSPPHVEERGMERARLLAAAALREGRPARDEARGEAAVCRVSFPVPMRGMLRTAIHLEAPGNQHFATDAGMEQIAAFIRWLQPALERVVGE